jgi:hypothetical protein
LYCHANLYYSSAAIRVVVLSSPCRVSGLGGMALPLLDYERMRIGLDDLAYLNTLEHLVEACRHDITRVHAVSAAESFISRLDALIHDDMQVYRQPKTGRANRWPVQRYGVLRDEVIELILDLQGTQSQD